jgi:hypothetical protein
MTINYVNSLIGQNKWDFTLFYNELINPCTKPLCAVMNISETWLYNGILISTDLDTSAMIAKTLKPKRKLFYIWDLEWLRMGKQNFLQNLQVYRNPNFELIARSSTHAEAITNYANRTVNAVIPDFHLAHLLNYIEKTDERRNAE